MSEISNYEAQKKKLQGLCDEHNFTFRFFKDRYPITLVITPINDVATQMDMLGNVEETGYCSQDSSMCWYFENSELKTKVKGTFSIDKVLRTKIENILLKMISFWQQFFFRDLMENGKLRNFGVPVLMCRIPILRGIPSRTPSRRPRRTTPTMNRPRTPLRTIRRNNRWQRQRQCEISGTTTKKHS
jgi:hypothetical protein